MRATQRPAPAEPEALEVPARVDVPAARGPEPLDLMTAMRERTTARGRRRGGSRRGPRKAPTNLPGAGDQVPDDAMPLEDLAYDPGTMPPPPGAHAHPEVPDPLDARPEPEAAAWAEAAGAALDQLRRGTRRAGTGAGRRGVARPDRAAPVDARWRLSTPRRRPRPTPRPPRCWSRCSPWRRRTARRTRPRSRRRRRSVAAPADVRGSRRTRRPSSPGPRLRSSPGGGAGRGAARVRTRADRRPELEVEPAPSRPPRGAPAADPGRRAGARAGTRAAARGDERTGTRVEAVPGRGRSQAETGCPRPTHRPPQRAQLGRHHVRRPPGRALLAVRPRRPPSPLLPAHAPMSSGAGRGLHWYPPPEEEPPWSSRPAHGSRR